MGCIVANSLIREKYLIRLCRHTAWLKEMATQVFFESMCLKWVALSLYTIPSRKTPCISTFDTCKIYGAGPFAWWPLLVNDHLRAALCPLLENNWKGHDIPYLSIRLPGALFTPTVPLRPQKDRLSVVHLEGYVSWLILYNLLIPVFRFHSTLRLPQRSFIQSTHSLAQVALHALSILAVAITLSARCIVASPILTLETRGRSAKLLFCHLSLKRCGRSVYGPICWQSNSSHKCQSLGRPQLLRKIRPPPLTAPTTTASTVAAPGWRAPPGTVRPSKQTMWSQCMNLRSRHSIALSHS